MSNLDSQKKVIPIVIATSVAKSSMKYWHKNFKKWSSLFKNKAVNSSRRKSASDVDITFSKSAIKNTVEADVGGAVAGALNSLADGSAVITDGTSTVAEAAADGLAASAGVDAAQLAGDAYDYLFG